MPDRTAFITGDRQGFDPSEVTLALLRAFASGAQVATGDNTGVEHTVRDVAQRAGVEVNVLETPFNDDGFRDFPRLHESLKTSFDELDIVFLHSEPSSSRIGASLVGAGLLPGVEAAEGAEDTDDD